MRYENRQLTGLTIRLDVDEVVNCRLLNCQILFGGMRQPVYSGNQAMNCGFHFAESAQITLEVLRRMLRVPALRDVVLYELGLLASEAHSLH